MGVLFTLLTVGTLVFAIVAQMTEPPLEPARTFMLEGDRRDRVRL